MSFGKILGTGVFFLAATAGYEYKRPPTDPLKQFAHQKMNQCWQRALNDSPSYVTKFAIGQRSKYIAKTLAANKTPLGDGKFFGEFTSFPATHADSRYQNPPTHLSPPPLSTQWFHRGTFNKPYIATEELIKNKTHPISLTGGLVSGTVNNSYLLEHALNHGGRNPFVFIGYAAQAKDSRSTSRGASDAALLMENREEALDALKDMGEIVSSHVPKENILFFAGIGSSDETIEEEGLYEGMRAATYFRRGEGNIADVPRTIEMTQQLEYIAASDRLTPQEKEEVLKLLKEWKECYPEAISGVALFNEEVDKEMKKDS